MSPSIDSSQLNTLSAAYSSPQLNRTFEHTITSTPPKPSQEDVKVKVAYLSELRKLVPVLQTDINIFLTEQMEEDKKASESQGRQLSDKEAKEEANYGEEVVEDDA
ncbi:EKC/KEOPS complex, subunit Gon7 [Aspergillus californicus]